MELIIVVCGLFIVRKLTANDKGRSFILTTRTTQDGRSELHYEVE